MGLLDRIWGGFTNTAQEELVQMLREFELDYAYDETFVYAIPLIEDFIMDMDYNAAWRLYQETAPLDVNPLDWELFEELLIEADLRR